MRKSASFQGVFGDPSETSEYIVQHTALNRGECVHLYFSLFGLIANTDKAC